MNVVSLTEPCLVDPYKQGKYVVFTLDGGLTLETLVEETKKHCALEIINDSLCRLNLIVHVGDSTNVKFEFPKNETHAALRWFEIVDTMVSM